MTAPTLAAPDRQARWYPVWLVTLTIPTGRDWAQSNFVQANWTARSTTTAPVRYSDRDLDVAGTFYHGRIVGAPVVTSEDVETFFGWTQVSEVRLTLSNADGSLTDLFTVDPRGGRLVLSRYDVDTGTTVAEFSGAIADVTLGGDGLVEVSASAPDLGVLEEPLPRGLVTLADWPNARDLGWTVPVVFGTVTAHRLVYVSDNVTTGQYDYLVSRGTVSVTAVYRDGPNGTLYLVDPSEYTVTAAVYTGYTVVRFDEAANGARQVDFANAFHALYADVTGLAAERNFATALKTLLSDTTYGLGQTVNAASFTTAAAALPASLYCDGVLREQRPAQDVLRDLLVRGLRLDINASGEWTCTADTQPATIRLALHDGTGDGERTLLAHGTRRRATVADTVSTVRVRYALDYPTNAYASEVARTVHPLGREQVVLYPFVRQAETADLLCGYLAARARYGTDLLDGVEITQEGRQLQAGDLVTVTSTPLGLAGETYEVARLEKGISRIRATLRLWSTGLYDTHAEDAPTAPSVGAMVEHGMGEAAAYRLVAEAEPWTLASALTGGLILDTTQSEIDCLIAEQVAADIYFAEASYDLVVATAMGVKVAGVSYFSAAAAFDGTNTQALLRNGTSIEYLKLDASGAISSGPTAKWSAYDLHACCVSGSVLYALLAETTGDTIRLAKTDLSGTETLAPTLLLTSTAGVANGAVVCVASDGYVHALIGEPTTGLTWLKATTAGILVDSDESVLAPASGFTSTFHPALVFARGPWLYVVGRGVATGTYASAFFLARLDFQGHVVADWTMIWQQALGLGRAHGVYDSAADVFYLPFSGSSATKVGLAKFSRVAT